MQNPHAKLYSKRDFHALVQCRCLISFQHWTTLECGVFDITSMAYFVCIRIYRNLIYERMIKNVNVNDMNKEHKDSTVVRHFASPIWPGFNLWLVLPSHMLVVFSPFYTSVFLPSYVGVRSHVDRIYIICSCHLDNYKRGRLI